MELKVASILSTCRSLMNGILLHRPSRWHPGSDCRLAWAVKMDLTSLSSFSLSTAVPHPSRKLSSQGLQTMRWWRKLSAILKP